MSSILGQIHWWNPAAGAPADIAGHYLAGRAAAERERQGAADREKMKADVELERARVGAAMSKQAAEEYRKREVMGQQALLQSIGRMEKLAGADPRLYQAAWGQERTNLAGTLPKVLPGLNEQIPDIVPPDQLPAFAQQLRKRITAASDPKVWDGYQNKAADMVAAQVGDSSLADPQFAREHPLWRKMLDKAIESGKPTTNINNITNPTKTAQEKVLSEGEETLGFIQDLRSMGKASGGFRNLTGMAPGLNLKRLEAQDTVAQLFGGKLSPADAEQLTRLTEFRGTLDSFSAKLTNQLLGATQSIEEWRRAQRGILNAEMGSAQFEAGLNRLERVTNRQMGIARTILSEGVLRQGTRAFGQEVDRRNKRAMIDEMKAQGMNDDQIVEELSTYGGG